VKREKRQICGISTFSTAERCPPREVHLLDPGVVLSCYGSDVDHANGLGNITEKITNDGGVLKKILAAGSGSVPPKHSVVLGTALALSSSDIIRNIVLLLDFLLISRASPRPLPL
jgi:hypothetical protein